MTKFIPLYDRLLVKRKETEEKTPFGILVPQEGQDKPVEGLVIATGEGRLLPDGQLRPLAVHVQDVVLFGKYSGTEVKVDGETFLVLKEDDVLGLIKRVRLPA